MKRKTNIFSENGILSGKRVLAATLSGVLFIGATIYSVAASDGLRSDGTPWKSTGDVVYEYTDGSGRQDTVFAKEDLDYIDDRITELKTDTTNGKRDLAQALNAYGYYKEADTSNIEQNATYEQLINAFSTSQSIPSGRTVNVDASGFIAESGGTETAVVGATAENISAGKAAWVDGELIIGNGADNKSYYAKGYVEGKAESLGGTNISYVYHKHIGSPSQEGGCYTKAVYKNKNETVTEVCPGYYHYIATEVNGALIFACDKCGRDQALSAEYGTDYTAKCPNTSWTHTKTVKVLDHYDPGCGKTTSTIESATITF